MFLFLQVALSIVAVYYVVWNVAFEHPNLGVSKWNHAKMHTYLLTYARIAIAFDKVAKANKQAFKYKRDSISKKSKFLPFIQKIKST